MSNRAAQWQSELGEPAPSPQMNVGDGSIAGALSAERTPIVDTTVAAERAPVIPTRQESLGVKNAIPEQTQTESVGYVDIPPMPLSEQQAFDAKTMNTIYPKTTDKNIVGLQDYANYKEMPPGYAINSGAQAGLNYKDNPGMGRAVDNYLNSAAPNRFKLGR